MHGRTCNGLLSSLEKQSSSVNKYQTKSNTIHMTKQFGLDWSVEKRPLVCGETGSKTSSYGLFRSDTGLHLGTVGRLYTPYQNESMIGVINDAASRLGYEVSRGGSLQGGRKVYAQVELDDTEIGNSNVKRYVTIINSHDGTHQVGVGMSNLVVVCSNQFNRMFKGGMNKVRHNYGVDLSVESMVDRIVAGVKQEAEVIEMMQRMADQKYSEVMYDRVVSEIFKPVALDASPDGFARATARREKGVAELSACISKDVEIHGDSIWGLFNGVTRFYTHYRGGATEEKRMNFNMVGNGSSVVNEVFDILSLHVL